MAYIADINALAGDTVISVLLEITIPATDTIRICNNNENIVFGGESYQPFPFQLSELTNSSSGEVPEWQVQIDNTSRAIEQYLQYYDAYLKKNGVIGNEINMTCYVVNALDPAEAILTEYFVLTSFSTDSQWASFKLGAKSPFTMRFPRRRILQNFCGWKFKSTQCGYTGAGATCDKTLATCKTYSNSARFGGFPGISKGIRV